MVALEVQQHRDRRRERVDVLELEARDLADDRRTGLDLPDEPAQRPPDVARHRCGEDVPEQLARRRLPLRPGDGEERVVGQEPERELDLAPDGDAVRAGSLHERPPRPGTPGLLTSTSVPSRSASSSSLPSDRSAPATSTPRASSAARAASPERARPSTSARFTAGTAGSSGRRGRSPDAQSSARDDPEAHDDLRLRPGLHLEVMVDRGDQEHAPAPVLERDDLDHHGEHLDQEEAADQEQQCLRAGDDREAGERAADRHRAGVAHDHLGREGVVPEEPDRPADERGREDREVEQGVGALAGGRRGADVGDHGDRQEGEQRDDPGPGGEPIETVGQVHPVRRSGDHEEEKRVEEVRELQVVVDDREVDGGADPVLLVHGDADHDR